MKPLPPITALALVCSCLGLKSISGSGRAWAAPTTGSPGQSATRPSSRPAAPRRAGPIDVGPNQPFIHQPTGFVFPPTIGSFRRLRVAQLDDAGRGVMVRYKDPDLKIMLTVAVYPGGGVGLVPHFEAIKASLLSKQAKARVTNEGKWTLRQAEADVTGMRMTYEYIGMLDGVEQDLEAQACLVPLAASYVRYDAIYPAGDAKAARGRAGRFMEVLKLP
jgi:hypothetical protein